MCLLACARSLFTPPPPLPHCRNVLRAISATVSSCRCEFGVCDCATTKRNITQLCCSDTIKAVVARACVSLCSCSTHILLPSATAIAQCFALRPSHFCHFDEDVTAASGSAAFCTLGDVSARQHERDVIGASLREASRDAMSAPAPHKTDVLACGIMLSLLKQGDDALLLSIFLHLLRSGNDGACRWGQPSHVPNDDLQ